MIFLSIINHNHDKMLASNPYLAEIAKKYNVLIKSNTPVTEELLLFSQRNNITLIDKKYGRGFSENNNIVFDYLSKNNIINDDDFFLVINPDVLIDISQLIQLEKETHKVKSDIYTINLFKDSDLSIHEYSIKRFPSLTGPLQGLFLKEKRTDSYDKENICEPIEVDWAAGSFLMFKKKCYDELKGFNQKFFMYFEDVDVCRRAQKKGMVLTYLPNIKAIHKGAFNNRNIFSKHFIWYLKSYLRYHFNF